MTSPRPDTWMPLYIGDYIADTGHLSTAEHGAYLLLIMAYWRARSPLPDDDDKLRRICRMTAREWAVSHETLEAFFKVADGIWRHKRIDDELNRSQGITEARSKAGSKGAATRWQTEGKIVAEPSDCHRQTDTPLPSQSKKDSPPRGVRTLARDWQPGPAVLQWCLLKALTDQQVEDEAEHFRSHYLSHGEARADWDEAFKAWCIKRPQFSRKSANGASDGRSKRGGTAEIRAGLASAFEQRYGDSPSTAATDQPEGAGRKVVSDG